ncbi:MAG: hypothetical protein OZX49_01270 [Immundisolibacter sp.]|nr:hypothetical protein [Immundisolibacter sp.]
MASAVGLASSCLLTWVATFCDCDTRVTRMAAATDSSSEGTCATRPSPMVSRLNTRTASPALMPCWPMPMAMPPRMLMIRISTPATASPRTNLLAPSMAP